MSFLEKTASLLELLADAQDAAPAPPPEEKMASRSVSDALRKLAGAEPTKETLDAIADNEQLRTILEKAASLDENEAPTALGTAIERPGPGGTPKEASRNAAFERFGEAILQLGSV